MNDFTINLAGAYQSYLYNTIPPKIKKEEKKKENEKVEPVEKAIDVKEDKKGL